MVAAFSTQHPGSGTGVSLLPGLPPLASAPARPGAHASARFEAVFMAGPDPRHAGGAAGSGPGLATEVDQPPHAMTDLDPPQELETPPQEPAAAQEDDTAAAMVMVGPGQGPLVPPSTGPGGSGYLPPETGARLIAPRAARPQSDPEVTGPPPTPGPGLTAPVSGLLTAPGSEQVAPQGGAGAPLPSTKADQFARPEAQAALTAPAALAVAAPDGALVQPAAPQVPGVAVPAMPGPGRQILGLAPPPPAEGTSLTDTRGAPQTQNRAADLAERRRAPHADTVPRSATPQAVTSDPALPASPQADPAIADPDPAASQDSRVPPSSGPLTSASGPTVAARADLPHAVAHQIAMTARRSGTGDRSVELELNPRELGRVRMKLIPGDGVLTVNMLVDRPETLDLMRRHGDLLERAMQEIGYHKTDFSFADGRSDTAGHSPQDGVAPPAAPAATPEPTGTIVIDLSGRARALSGDRLDLLI